MSLPTVFAYEDYRAFVLDWLAERPQLSRRWLAKRVHAGPTFVAAVLRGSRNLGLHDGGCWAEALGLAGPEAAHFDAMVRAAHAPTPALRSAARLFVQASREYAAAFQPAPEQDVLLRRWEHLAILELARCAGFDADPAWVARHLWPTIDEATAAGALERLRGAGLLVRDGDRWRVDAAVVATAAQVRTAGLAEASAALHRDQLDHASRSLDAFAGDRRYVASVTIAVPEDEVGDLLSAAHRAQLGVVQSVTAERPTRVMEVLVAVFPRSEVVG